MRLFPYPLISAVLFVLIHLLTEKIRLKRASLHRLLHSIAGGVSVAYAFVHLLPEIGASSHVLDEIGIAGYTPYSEALPYLVLLLGLIVFYGFEKSSRRAHRGAGRHREQDICGAGAFAVHVFVAAVFNGFIGYLLHHKSEIGPTRLPLFTLAMGLHFFIIDHWMTHNHEQRFRRFGRWILSAAVLAGWGLGLFFVVEEYIVALIFAFLAGAVLMNVLKEELPLDRENNFWPFALSSVIFAAILLLLR